MYAPGPMAAFGSPAGSGPLPVQAMGFTLVGQFDPFPGNNRYADVGNKAKRFTSELVFGKTVTVGVG